MPLIVIFIVMFLWTAFTGVNPYMKIESSDVSTNTYKVTLP